MFIAKNIIFVLLLFLMSACAPGLGSSLKLTMIEEAEVSQLSEEVAGTTTRVNVLKFQDMRTVEAIAQIDGRLIKPDGDVGLIVQRAFEQNLKASGVQLSLFDAPNLRGEINEWRVFITPGFPSTTLDAVASIHVELLDGAHKVVHRAEYSGEFKQQDPFIGESSVQSALGTVMAYAMKEALSDPIFINRLATLQARRE